MKHLEQSSEAVAIGHPDKVADSLADAILDEIVKQKSDAHTAVEIACGANKLFVFGEIDANVNVSRETIETAIKKRLVDIGYVSEDYSPEIIIDIVQQSVEINAAVEHSEDTGETGAGDQGIMFGYATAETPEMHSLHFVLAHLLQKKLEETRKSGALSFLKPDAKSQVTVLYKYTEKGINKPIAIKDIVLSTQHTETNFQEMRENLTKFVAKTANEYLENNNFGFTVSRETNIHINPAGEWHKGGPAADSGLTGRKLVVDNYGGNAPIGGGAYSGKDLTKVDRSAAYYARHIAKSVIASNLAQKIQVSLAYAIGMSQPTMISIDTYGTGIASDEKIQRAIERTFDFSVDNIVNFSSSIKAFVKTGEHSHYLSTPTFLAEGEVFPWEKTAQIVL